MHLRLFYRLRSRGQIGRGGCRCGSLLEAAVLKEFVKSVEREWREVDPLFLSADESHDHFRWMSRHELYGDVGIRRRPVRTTHEAFDIRKGVQLSPGTRDDLGAHDTRIGGGRAGQR